MKNFIDEYGDAIVGVFVIGFVVGIGTFILVTGRTPGTLFHYINTFLGRIA